MTAVELITSDIVHVRHGSNEKGKPSHVLERKGLSVWIDLDQLDEAGRQSALFSVGRFNLLSFHPQDYGPNFLAKKHVENLAQYARKIANEVKPDAVFDQVKLLTFPRILGMAFNPISVYQLTCRDGDAVVIYEVRNTFGDMHSYVGTVEREGRDEVHHAAKRLHVSPFFSMDGGYKLKLREDDEKLSLLIHYHDDGAPLLTATLRGMRARLNTSAVLAGFMKTRLFPMRPLISIHLEALKLWLKRVQFFRRPEPDPMVWSKAETSEDK